jgi:Arc/MetJ family transcription regulator
MGLCSFLKKGKIMPTNLAIDDRLIKEAQTVGQHKTKKAAVSEALEEYVQKRKQVEILDLFGKINYDHDYDYKKQREID